MKERPILFNTEMVKAILDGRKTMTRRVIKPQPIITGLFADYKNITTLIENLFEFCPHGQVGDRFWVRETWRPYSEKDVQIEYRADGVVIDYPERPQFSFYGCGQNWKPSIHMPRWASRIILDIIGIKVERLQDITEDDTIAEGIVMSKLGTNYQNFFDGTFWINSSKPIFESLWDSINSKRGYPWTNNPWVWVISFKTL